MPVMAEPEVQAETARLQPAGLALSPAVVGQEILTWNSMGEANGLPLRSRPAGRFPTALLVAPEEAIPPPVVTGVVMSLKPACANTLGTIVENRVIMTTNTFMSGIVLMVGESESRLPASPYPSISRASRRFPSWQ